MTFAKGKCLTCLFSNSLQILKKLHVREKLSPEPLLITSNKVENERSFTEIIPQRTLRYGK